MTYQLRSAVEAHNNAPATFAIPDPDFLATIVAGDVVKLMFEPTGHDDPDAMVERMWVEVTVNGGVGETAGEWTGTVNNHPAQPDLLPELGTPVTFAWSDIIDAFQMPPQ